MSSPLSDVQQIYTDNPGALAAEYDLTSDISVQSIVARIDGSGAAASFLPTLSLYSQDGKLIARVPSDITYAIGDTGVVTWSPFLVRRITSALVLNLIGAYVRRPATSPQTVGSSFTYDTTITFTDVIFDPTLMWSAGQPTRLTIAQGGIYLFSGTGSFVTNATNGRGVALFKNGATVLNQMQTPAPPNTFWVGTTTVVDQFVAGDYVEVKVTQDSGGNLNTGTCWLSGFGVGQS